MPAVHAGFQSLIDIRSKPRRYFKIFTIVDVELLL